MGACQFAGKNCKVFCVVIMPTNIKVPPPFSLQTQVQITTLVALLVSSSMVLLSVTSVIYIFIGLNWHCKHIVSCRALQSGWGSQCGHRSVVFNCGSFSYWWWLERCVLSAPEEYYRGHKEGVLIKKKNHSDCCISWYPIVSIGVLHLKIEEIKHI